MARKMPVLVACKSLRWDTDSDKLLGNPEAVKPFRNASSRSTCVMIGAHFRIAICCEMHYTGNVGFG